MKKIFKDIIGQNHLITTGKPIYKMIEQKKYLSLILYGKPGIGKTTIANAIGTSAKENGYKVFNLNAATDNKTDIKNVTDKLNANLLNKSGEDKKIKILLIIDEIHRLDKNKQDFLLPYLENDNFVLIGTTTDNPYYVLQNAIRSRMLMFQLLDINSEDIKLYLKENIFKNKNIDDKVIEQIVKSSGSDVRQSINISDFLNDCYEQEDITIDLVLKTFPQMIIHDTTGTLHHDLLSAMQKSIRAGDINAALHYTARLLLVGEEKALVRRLYVTVYEDISVANPSLCSRIATDLQVYEKIGMPEGDIIISKIITEMCLSPKTNAPHIYMRNVIKDIKENNIQDINPFIKFNQDPNYKYNKEKAKFQNLLPISIKDKEYYYSNQSSKFDKAQYSYYINRQDNIK